MTIEPAISDHLREARDARGRHAWQDAVELFTRAELDAPLSGPDLESLAEVAWFTAQADLALEARERAFKVYQADGNHIRAAYIAVDLATRQALKGQPSLGSAWARRAERLLEGQPETYAHGYLSLARSDRAAMDGDLEEALRLADEAIEIAGRTTNPDLQAMGQTTLGRLRIASGATSVGLALLEDATFAAVNGELSPTTTGITYCQMIGVCRDLNDLQRASEWTHATEQWCEREQVGGFPGICRVHRAEIVALNGDWDRAEVELAKATRELAAYQAGPVIADGFYALGELRIRKGDLAGAEDALRQSHAHGRDPQPALSLIRLAEGKVGQAFAAINSAVDSQTWDQWARARLLPAQVEICVAAGDSPKARAAADELTRLTETYKSHAMEATLDEAWGRVLLAEGDAAGAAVRLRSAVRTWRRIGLPFEIARSRALLGTALLAVPDLDGAELELKAANDEFVRLGAALAAEGTSKMLQTTAERRGAPVQVMRTFMFTDIEASTRLAEALGDEAWERLLQWHDGTIRDLVRKHAGVIVSTTGDGFFIAFESAAQAVECAIAVQRTLADHRRQTGFALSVRIGLHSAVANRRGGDFSGVGVHIAARVAAIAFGGEIVTTADTLAGAEAVRASEPREVSLKGVSAPIRVVTVAWS